MVKTDWAVGVHIILMDIPEPPFLLSHCSGESVYHGTGPSDLIESINLIWITDLKFFHRTFIHWEQVVHSVRLAHGTNKPGGSNKPSSSNGPSDHGLRGYLPVLSVNLGLQLNPESWVLLNPFLWTIQCYVAKLGPLVIPSDPMTSVVWYTQSDSAISIWTQYHH